MDVRISFRCFCKQKIFGIGVDNDKIVEYLGADDFEIDWMSDDDDGRDTEVEVPNVALGVSEENERSDSDS